MEKCSIAGLRRARYAVLLCTCGWSYEEKNRRQGTARSTARLKAQWDAHMKEVKRGG